MPQHKSLHLRSGTLFLLLFEPLEGFLVVRRAGSPLCDLRAGELIAFGAEIEGSALGAACIDPAIAGPAYGAITSAPLALEPLGGRLRLPARTPLGRQLLSFRRVIRRDVDRAGGAVDPTRRPHGAALHFEPLSFGAIYSAGSRNSLPSPLSSESCRPGVSGESSRTGFALPSAGSTSTTSLPAAANSTVGQVV